jgi:hypothetical protein
MIIDGSILDARCVSAGMADKRQPGRTFCPS